MSNAWETTVEDVLNVLDAHNIKVDKKTLNELHEGLDLDDIETGLLYYSTMECQISSMLSDIEDHLMSNNVIPRGDKIFTIDEMDDVID